ncbi:MULTISPECIES: NUDIX hydrolase [Auritidibacter]|uniref:NUDIX hydrolase n=1 Tax=Auritidibacter TaxID=1160973 RepID=UPI000D7342EC|nr:MULTISPECIES: NUDIX hydrolase [Auritidibacter]PXA75722.1 NUDIX hydrolase [Auritidibacter sp. NML100628]WGH84203.1 NUDIX hydrolase [Auritidibacter ignavus]
MADSPYHYVPEARNNPDHPAHHVPVRPAASVVLLRDQGVGVEVFVQFRAKTMDFAAGVAVFPGGRSEPGDHQAGDGLLSPEAIAEHAQIWSRTKLVLDDATPGVAAMAATAVREVWEETAVRLSGEQLVPWANITTPLGAPKRFDTYFYVAAVTDEQQHQVRNVTTEATEARWLSTTDLLQAFAAEQIALMRPTLYLVKTVHALKTIPEIVAGHQPVVTPLSGLRGVTLDSDDSHFTAETNH